MKSLKRVWAAAQRILIENRSKNQRGAEGDNFDSEKAAFIAFFYIFFSALRAQENVGLPPKPA